MPAPTGAHTTLSYLWEVDANDTPDFGAGQATEDTDRKPFGGNPSLSQFEGSNNALDVFEPNSRERAQLIAQHFDGAVSIDFELSNPWWIQGVISEVTESVDNGDGTYTHHFDGDIPLPMTIYAGYDDRATADGEGPGYRVLEGVVIDSGSISVNVEQVIEVSLTGAYVNEEWMEVTSLDPQPSLDYDVMTFAEAGLYLDDGFLSLVQDASLEINNNTDIIREIGSRVGVDYSPKGHIPSVDYTKIREDSSEVQEMYGSEAATAVEQNVDSDKPMTFEADNGQTGEGVNTVEFGLDGSFPSSMSTENFGNPQEDLQESINRELLSAVAEATNSEAEAR